MAGATAAMRPPEMATSRTSEMPFFGSMTWPPPGYPGGVSHGRVVHEFVQVTL